MPLLGHSQEQNAAIRVHLRSSLRPIHLASFRLSAQPMRTDRDCDTLGRGLTMTRILIADPDPRARQALGLLLERKLATICIGEAWDRASLERQLAALQPDALLMDCHLPGLAVADIAALQGRLTGIRLALMSVDSDDVEIAQRLNARFIYKGALPDEVLATLRGLIVT